MSNNSNLFDCSETKFIWRVGDTAFHKLCGEDEADVVISRVSTLQVRI